MRDLIGKLLLLSFLFLNSLLIKGQVNGNNLLEYQYGEIPNDTSSFSGLYDRAIVNYKYEKFKASLTLEQYHTPYGERNYTKLTQYAIQYKSDPLEVTIGNFYETIGRGTLLRSFEIPGAVLEDLSYRSRQYFHRDILGALVKYRYKGLSTKILYGSPLNNVFPPTVDDSIRRLDITEAIYAEYSFNKQTIGASALRLTNQSGSSVYGMFTASGKLTSSVSYFTEIAKQLDTDITDFSSNASYGLYGGINVAFNNLGISTEVKKYNNFLLGSGINEPPALVKEHSYKVLNRSTHVSQPLNESGYQVELYYTFPDFSTLTINNALAFNDFGTEFTFQEYFAEYSFSIFDQHDVKIFADYAEDPFKSEKQRVSGGIYMEWKAFKNSIIKTDYEFQTFNRNDSEIQNHVFSVGYGYHSKFVMSVVTEISNDAFLVDNGKDYKLWIGTNLKYQINNENNIQLFAGQRRGGPACNAGVCYEVLDFTGVELRLTSRF